MNWSSMFGFLAVALLCISQALIPLIDSAASEGRHVEADWGQIAHFTALGLSIVFGALCALTWGVS
ncbi:hypothetical protein GCM10011273_17270 [Asticcacaulis endophyticus]|uniref:Uncharacterized protein n=1 Tax=Asticcacaulis endophyticus TaxID=1395890 RepID=A0A918Q5N2_9CAUL|nr:hypothetical protein GCM10011273_17270 [Asticcacaulis endophyticus]